MQQRKRFSTDWTMRSAWRRPPCVVPSVSSPAQVPAKRGPSPEESPTHAPPSMGSARHARRDLLRQSGRGNAQQTIPTRRRIRRQSRHLPLRGTTPTPSDLARRMRRPMPFISRNPREIVEHSLRRVTTQQVDDDTVRNLQAEINWCKISLIAPEDYERVCAAIHHQPPAGLEPSQFVDVYKAYETEKINRNEIDFDDILLITCHLIESDEDVAASIRSGITWLTVDEYQDVSPLQHRLLTRWLGDNRNICVVGDPAQTIYSFAGASSYNLLNFASEFGPLHRRRQTQQRLPFHPADSSTTPTACSKPHRNAPTISNSTPSETQAAESRKPSTTAISKKPGAWLHASADSWTREHLRATAPSSPESTRSRKSSAGHWANNTCATASNETADGRTPRSRMTLRPAWPCWKHLAQAATLKV